MKQILVIIIIALLLLSAVGIYLINKSPAVEETPDDELVSYFASEMWRRSSELTGAMPVEGYTPDMYLGIYQNLKKEDFNNAEAIGGVWIFENNELKYQKTSDEITSADGTVTESGMGTLLNNLKTRLNLDIDTEEDVDELIDGLD